MPPLISVDELKISGSENVGLIAARELRLSRLLIAYIASGLFFMLLPGTFVGVWNLLAISSHRSVETVSPAWIQAHGHAQVFGWIGSFILGIGYYSIPKLRRMKPFALWPPWTSLLMWSSGVTLRWVAGVYEWHWRILLPVSAGLEIAAFLIFLRSVSSHRPTTGKADDNRAELDEWILVVIAGCIGWLAALAINLLSAVFLAWRGASPVLPHGFDQRLLVLETWGFLVPFIWGFSAKWLPTFLGLRALHSRQLLWAVALNSAGVIVALFGSSLISSLLLLTALAVAAYALRLFEPSDRAPKIQGVHISFPLFVRVGYIWAFVSSVLAIWASVSINSAGIWGASRHALTVGFVGMMVFCVGQRILPAFSGMRLLFSTRLMFAALALLSIGCLLRVGAEVLAYQGFARAAWSWLPVSAITEMTAVTIFAVNLAVTFMRRKNRAELQYRDATRARWKSRSQSSVRSCAVDWHSRTHLGNRSHESSRHLDSGRSRRGRSRSRYGNRFGICKAHWKAAMDRSAAIQVELCAFRRRTGDGVRA